MSDTASDDDSFAGLARTAICAPLTFFLEASRRLPEAFADGEKQLAMARNLGRVALRAAESKRDRPQAPSTPRSAASAEVEAYDAMTAREVVAVIGTASAETLAWIRTREMAGKARVTIIRALDRRGSSGE